MSQSMSRTESSSRHSQSNSAALRPRTKRFITGLEDLSPDYHINGSAVTSTNGTPYASPYESRQPSPIPSKHPSRSSSRQPLPGSQSARNSLNAGFSGSGSDLTTSLSRVWGKSWTNLQSLASNVLGNEALEPIKDKIPVRTKRTYDLNIGNDKKWGPPSRDISQPGAGTKEERKALVIAKKREELLKGGDSDLYLDASGPRYKRRTSDDFDSASVPPVQTEERDSLVYIHHVSPTDTLPGISIKFNCPLPTIKKANRLWSNDGIHSRKTLAIPLDACNVKGRRVAGPEGKGRDFLTDAETENDRRCSSDTITPNRLPASPPDGHEDFPTMPTTKPAEENPWTHDSWILLENQTTAIEIARMSRQDLGFFPRARRKSVSYSDLDTPSESFDLPRPSITISDTSVTPERTFQHKSRRSSSSHAFAPKMMGPGGVGTLGGKGPSAPGPGEDKFSKALQRALPKFTAQPTFEELDEQQGSGTTTPIYNIEHVGSAIEGWVRNIAHKAAKVVEPPSPNIQRGRDTGIRGGAGDLIELEDAIDLGGEDDTLPDPAMFDDEPHRGRGSRRATGSSIEDQRKVVVARNLIASRKKGD